MQNFLYLSQSFDDSHATEGMQNVCSVDCSADTDTPWKDFRATVEPSVPMAYAEKDFGPVLQAVIRFVLPLQSTYRAKDLNAWFRKARDVRFWKLVAREPIPSWHKDRLVVIGDAAHPMLTCKLRKSVISGLIGYFSDTGNSPGSGWWTSYRGWCSTRCSA